MSKKPKKPLTEKQLAALKKHQAPVWQKGQSGNLAGKPKGIRHRSTILAELLELTLRKKNEEGRLEDVAHPLDPDQKTITIEAAINAALISRALKGDVRAIQEIQDTMYGKIKETKVLENPDGSAINLTNSLTPAQAAKAYQDILQKAKKRGDKK